MATTRALSAALATSPRPASAPRLADRRPGRHQAAPRRRAAAAASSSGSGPSAQPGVLTDATVPEGHQGLHGFLYGEGGAEAHDAPSGAYTFREVRAGAPAGLLPPLPLSRCRRRSPPPVLARLHTSSHACTRAGVLGVVSPTTATDPSAQGEDDGSALLPVAAWLAAREGGGKPVGVYALSDARRNLQYVGYARNIVLAVRVSRRAVL